MIRLFKLKLYLFLKVWPVLSAHIPGSLGVLLLLSALAMFTCKQCPDHYTTDSSQGLSLHQNKCPAYIRRTQDIFTARKTLGSRKLNRRSTLKAWKLHPQDADHVGAADVQNTVRRRASRLCSSHDGIKLTIYQQVPTPSTSNVRVCGTFDSNSDVPGNYSDELPNEIANATADFVHSEPPMSFAPPSPTPPALTQSGRPQRNYRVPRRYVDLLPEAVPILHEEEPLQVLPRVRLYVRDKLQTAPNVFGVWREYLYCPSYDPESAIPTDDLRIRNPTTIGSDAEVSDSDESGGAGILSPCEQANSAYHRVGKHGFSNKIQC